MGGLCRSSGGELAWLANAFAAVSASGHPLARRAISLLRGAQQPDGLWLTADGDAFRVTATLAAIRALEGERT
jgi:hypothetical protein